MFFFFAFYFLFLIPTVFINLNPFSFDIKKKNQFLPHLFCFIHIPPHPRKKIQKKKKEQKKKKKSNIHIIRLDTSQSLNTYNHFLVSNSQSMTETEPWRQVKILRHCTKEITRGICSDICIKRLKNWLIYRGLYANCLLVYNFKYLAS